MIEATPEDTTDRLVVSVPIGRYEQLLVMEDKLKILVNSMNECDGASRHDLEKILKK